MNKLLTILNRGVWLTALVSTVTVIVMVRSHFGSSVAISSLRGLVAAEEQSIEAAAKREAARDIVLQQKIRTIETLKRKVQTPEQALAALPAALSELPLPITMSRLGSPTTNLIDPNHQADPAGTTSSVNSAGGATDMQKADVEIGVPAADLKPLYDHLQDCREAATSLETLRQDLTDTRGQLMQMATERDIANRQHTPGGRWQNFKRATKWLAIGAGIGVILSRRF